MSILLLRICFSVPVPDNCSIAIFYYNDNLVKRFTSNFELWHSIVIELLLSRAFYADVVLQTVFKQDSNMINKLDLNSYCCNSNQLFITTTTKLRGSLITSSYAIQQLLH